MSNIAFSFDDITEYRKNPRVLTDKNAEWLSDKMSRLGDISGITINRPTQEFITGNQRSKEIKKRLAEDGKDFEIIWTKEYDAPTASGTVALGYVEVSGESFNVRLVDWDEETCDLACIVGNQGAGDWDAEKLLESFDSELLTSQTLFNERDLDKFIKDANFQGDLILTDRSGAQSKNEDDDALVNAYASGEEFKSQVRMVQLFLNSETQPIFLEKEAVLRQFFETENVTDTVTALMNTFHDTLVRLQEDPELVNVENAADVGVTQVVEEVISTEK